MNQRRHFIKTMGALGTGLGISSNLYATESRLNKAEKPSSIFGLIKLYIEKGNIKELKKILISPQINTLRDERDRSLLWIASLNGKPELFDVLAQGYKPDMFDYAVTGNAKGISALAQTSPETLNIKNKYGYTPLLAACECGQAVSVEILVSIGAKLNVGLDDESKSTSLTLALQNENDEKLEWMTQILLGNGADPNKSANGTFPIHLAIKRKNVFAIKMLIRKNTDLTQKDSNGHTVSSLAKGTIAESIISTEANSPRDLYITRHKLKNNQLAEKSEHPELPFQLINDFVTVAHFDLEKTKNYLDKIPGLINTKTTWDEMAIEGCTHLGNEKVASFLLDKGAPYSICTATMFGDIHTVKSMLGNDQKILYDRGPHDFPLIWYTAIGKPKLSIAEILLDRGLDINAQIRGRTILSECANRGHAELMDFLLQKGANPSIVSNSIFLKGTPYEIARRRKQDLVLKVLESHGINK